MKIGILFAMKEELDSLLDKNTNTEIETLDIDTIPVKPKEEEKPIVIDSDNAFDFDADLSLSDDMASVNSVVADLLEKQESIRNKTRDL